MADTIFDHPELGLQKAFTEKNITDYLSQCGFQVEYGVGGIYTSFRAVFQNGEGGPRISLLCEYDALEGLGHAYGHHMWSPAMIGAARALKECTGELSYTVVVYGTPRREDRSR